MIFVLVLGIALLAWGFWNRLGPTPGARRWASVSSRPETRLFMAPFGGAALVLAALLGPLEDVQALFLLVGLAFFACVLIALVFGMFGVPAPAFLKPRWYRELDRRVAGKRSGSRRREARPTPPEEVEADAGAIDPAWTPVRDALRADIAGLQPEGSIVLTADPQRFVEVWHYGDRISVDCAGSQAWGGPAPVSDEQDAALCRLGFTTPMQRRRELEQNANFRIYLPTDEPSTPARAAELSVRALAILGVEPGAHLGRSLS